MTRKQKRLAGIGAIGLVLAAALVLVLFALSNQIRFFYFPEDIHTGAVTDASGAFRLGGLVKNNSVKKAGTKVAFVITDGEFDVPVTFVGIVPDLFREGQGVVAEGRLSGDGEFIADNVLAKHDENYMPKEVADALKDKGEWRGDKQ